MMLQANHNFQNAQFSLGPFIKCPHPEMIEILGIRGFDFAVVDMEHTPLGPRDLYPLVLAAERRNMDLIVRIPELSEIYLKWCLDLNVSYIQVPFVQNQIDAQYAVSKSHFNPVGNRGLCRFTRAADFSNTVIGNYIENAQSKTRLILQIEGAEGLKNIHEILQVENLFALFIGPYDLSQSLGKPGQIWDKTVVEAMKQIIEACKKKNVCVGTFADSLDGVRFWTEAGVSIIEYGSDLSLLMQGCEWLQEPFRNSSNG